MPSRIAISTSTTLGGPWWLDRAALQDFDSTVDSAWQRLLAAEPEVIEKRLKRSGPYLAENYEQVRRKDLAASVASERLRQIRIGLGRDRELIVESFHEAELSVDLQHEHPLSFEARVRCGDVDATVRVSDRVRIDVEPEHLAPARELFVVLQSWAIRHQRPLWWRVMTSGPVAAVFVMLGLILLLFVASPSSSRTDLPQDAKQLLVDGIKSEEVPRALQLLIEKEFFPTQDAPSPLWVRLAFLTSALVVLRIWFWPSVLLGIGSGERRFRVWHAVDKFATISLPGFVFLQLFLPWLMN